MKIRLFAMIMAFCVAFWMAQSMFLQKKVMINSCRHTDESGSARTCCNCADIVTMADGSTDDHKHLETPTYNRSFRWGSFLLAVS